MAPCMGYVSREEYMKQIKEIVDVLEGKTDDLIKQLDLEIKESADKLQYEKAAYLRDKKIAIERISEKQKVSNISENDIDVIGLARNETKVCVEVFFVRKSKMIGREHFFLNDLVDETSEEILSTFIKQYYNAKRRNRRQRGFARAIYKTSRKKSGDKNTSKRRKTKASRNGRKQCKSYIRKQRKGQVRTSN